MDRDIVDRLRDQQAKFMTPILGQAADEIERLRGNISLRDKFIVNIGQWMSFVDSLPDTAPPKQLRG